MSRWNIAAAQYAPRHSCVDEHVKHHLHFIAEAAWHGCDLIVFPELSLTGPGGTTLPPPPLTICSLLPSFTPRRHVSSR